MRDIHSSYEDVASRLDAAYDRARRGNDWQILSVVLGRWGEIGVDAILCQKLVQRGVIPSTVVKACSNVNELSLISPGVVSKVVQLLNTPVDGTRLLRLLAILTQHGSDASLKLEVLRAGGKLLRLIGHIQDDPFTIGYGVVGLAHSLEAAYVIDSAPDVTSLLRQLSLPTLPRIVLDMIRSLPPSSLQSYNIVVHAIHVLIFGADTCPWDQRHMINPSLKFLAAFLRSKDIGVRLTALNSFMSLHPDEKPRAVVLPLLHDPEDFPPNVRRLIGDHGLLHFESTLFGRCQRRFLRAVLDFVRTSDLYKYGITVADILLECEVVDPHEAGLPNLEHVVQPYNVSWWACLSIAARHLRGRRDSYHLDMADVIDLELLSVGSVSGAEAVLFARNVLQRNPNHVYAHFVLQSRTTDREEQLRIARHGLDLEGVSPYIRRQTLLALMNTSAYKAWLSLFQAPPQDYQTRRQAEEYIATALRYAEIYISEAPLDCHDLGEVLDLYIANTFVLKGSQLDQDLSELQVGDAFSCRSRAIANFPVTSPLWTHSDATRKSYRSFARFSGLTRPVQEMQSSSSIFRTVSGNGATS